MALSTAHHPPERSKIEQIVLEFFAKSIHIILESRIPGLCGEVDLVGSSASSSSSGPNTRDRWFNLALGDCTAALENFEPWRRSFSDPLFVDILLKHTELSGPLDLKGGTRAKGDGGRASDEGEGSVLERWTVQFEVGKGEGPAKTGVMLPTYRTEVSTVYQRTIVMLRSLYCRSRLLPAYRLLRLATTSSNYCSFNLSYKVLSFGVPASELDTRDMVVLNFTPVETGYGRMCLSVAYRRTTAITAIELTPSILPRIIPDYVGSPSTDPLRRFPGEPHSLPSSGISFGGGVRMVSVPSSLQGPPSDLGFGRRHSWTGRLDQMQPALQPPSSPSYHPSVSPSPSFPIRRNPLSSSPHSLYSRKHPSSDYTVSPLSSPLSPGDRSLSNCHVFDTTFSPSPSPSPPTTYSGSAPVSIPKPSHSRGLKYGMADGQQSSRYLLPPLSPSAKKTGAMPRSSSGSPRFCDKDASHTPQARSFESPIQSHMLYDYGQQVGKNASFAAETFFRGQSHTALSRSSSKPSLGDDGDEEEFSCPFVVDDVDAAVEKQSGKPDISGPEREHPDYSSSSSKGTPRQNLQDAAVGVLVKTFKSAPPLREPFLCEGDQELRSNRREFLPGSSLNVSPAAARGKAQVAVSKPGVPTDFRAKTARDAIEELQLYKHTRDALRQSADRLQD